MELGVRDMKTIEEVKEYVGKLIAEKNLSYSNIALRLGRNPTYLQKFVKEKYPKRLDEVFRRELALILEVPEQELSDRPINTIPLPSAIEGTNFVAEVISGLFTKLKNKKDIVSIEMLDVTACCGNGIENIAENIAGHWTMPMPDFRQITMSAPENIKLLRVKGDSMNPTLKDGDWVMVDITRKAPDSDGLFLLLLANGLAVKRVQCGLGQNITVISDNPIYAPIPATLEEVPIAGKIIYTLKSEKVG
jgi:SOS-response transcriptional repressor LexA